MNKMPTYCCVLGCRNKADKQKNISLFRFPLQSKDILEWVSFVGRTNWQPTSSSRICSLHFNSDDYYCSNDRLFLYPGVLPKKYIMQSDKKENDDPFKVLNDKLPTVNTSKRAAKEILEREIIKIHETPSESSNEIEILKKQLQNERELHQQELKRQAEVFSKILENEKSKLMSKIKSGQHKLYTLQRSIQRKEEHIKNMKHLFDELKKKY